MNELGQNLVDGLLEREADCGATITWAGADYPCSGGAELGGKSVTAGGLRVTCQVTIVVRAELFAGGAAPQEKHLVVYRQTAEATGRTLRIDSVNSVLGAALVLECNDPRTGA